MTRIAVLGANGQVGAEICLLLQNHPGVTVVPICRNRLGSAFLRYRGVACRHGRAAVPAETKRLLGDCDVVLNSAFVSGLPREARERNCRLIESAVRGSAAGARIIQLSTLMVHGDPRPGRRVRWRSAYSQEKRAGERDATRFGRKCGKPVWVLRLGHVCGELQGITRQIRERIAAEPVALPPADVTSNVVYTATIVDAVLGIVAGRVETGVYDLVCHPKWSWREVFEREARVSGHEPRWTEAEVAPSGRADTLAFAVWRLVSAGVPREIAMRLLSVLSPGWNLRLQAAHYRRRAATEIAALRAPSEPMEGLDWIDLARHPLEKLTPTAELLGRAEYALPPFDPARSWPPDLPPATTG